MSDSSEVIRRTPLSLFEAHAASYADRMQRADPSYIPDIHTPGSTLTNHPQARDPVGLRYILRRLVKERRQSREPVEGLITVIELPADEITSTHVDCFDATFMELATTGKGEMGYLVKHAIDSGDEESTEVTEVQLEIGLYLSRRTTQHTDGLYLSPTSAIEEVSESAIS